MFYTTGIKALSQQKLSIPYHQGIVRSLQGLNVPETQKNKGFQQHLWLL